MVADPVAVKMLLGVIATLMGVQTPLVIFYAAKVWEHSKKITKIETRCHIFHKDSDI